MARQEKGSRRKFLPIRVQLNEIDALTGSFPTIANRIASDGTVGNFNIHFDDNNTVNFQTYENIVFGTHLQSGSAFITTDSADSNNETSINFRGTGNLKPEVIDTNPLIILSNKFNVPSQSQKLFSDSDNFAVDGKSKEVEFYATGSRIENVGLGFNQPLWSKTKIEIDLSVAKECSLECKPNTSASSYPMGYFNFDTKVWEGIGTGIDPANIAAREYGQTSPIFRVATVGFAPSTHIRYGVPGVTKGAGHPINQFGFPFDPKYHATSSQVLKMDKFISAPFLLEKIVLHVSCTYSGNYTGYANGNVNSINGIQEGMPSAMNTFFICNQFSNEKLRDHLYGAVDNSLLLYNVHVNVPSSSVVLSKEGAPVNITTLRDLITYGNIVVAASNLSASHNITGLTSTPLQDITRELVIRSNGPNLKGATFSGNIIMSGTVSAPVVQNSDVATSVMYITSSVVDEKRFLLAYGPAQHPDIPTEKTGTRSAVGLARISTRNFLNVNYRAQVDGLKTFNYGLYGSVSYVNQYSIACPYLLLPTDNLIFGWQLPVSAFAYTTGSNDTFVRTTFGPGPAKIIFYGSMISDGKEYHQTSNQLLSSNVVHEVIGE